MTIEMTFNRTENGTETRSYKDTVTQGKCIISIRLAGFWAAPGVKPCVHCGAPCPRPHGLALIDGEQFVICGDCIEKETGETLAADTFAQVTGS